MLGIFQIITLTTSFLLEEPIPRITDGFSIQNFTVRVHAPIQVYQNKCSVGYSKIKVKSFDYVSEAAVT